MHIISWDTRDMSKFDYWSMSGQLNYDYAVRNNHTYSFYSPSINNVFNEKNAYACELQESKMRRCSPWCKLLAISHAMRFQKDMVVFVDSDAYLKQMEKIFSKFQKSPHCLWMPQNTPWAGTNSAMQLWKTTNTCKGLLKKWWLIHIHVDTSTNNMQYRNLI